MLEDGRFPDRFAPLSVAADAAAAATARAGAEAAAAGVPAAVTAEVTTQVDPKVTAAQTARTGAETARTGAETAKTGAETARTGAETARTGAEAALAGVPAAVETQITTPGTPTRAALNATYAPASLGTTKLDKAEATLYPKPGRSIARRLKDKSEAVVIGMVGDSTGDETTEWFELLTAWLAAQAPTVPVKVARWNDAVQGYGLPQTIQTGTTEASVAFVGLSHYIVTPDTAQVSVTGDIAMMVDIALTDWTPASNSPALVTKFGAAGQRSYRFYVEQTTGLLVFTWYADGTTGKTVKSSVAPTVADGARLRVGVELDVDDGAGSHAVRFYVGTGLNGWTQLGTTQVAAGGGTTSVFDSTTQLALGSRSDTNADCWTGTFYSGALLSGMLQTGKVVAGYDPGLYPAQQGTQALRGTAGQTWTPVGVPVITYSPMLLAYNGSKSNMGIAYSADATRLALQTPIEPQLFFISYGHNETSGVLSTWDALATQIRTRYPLCPIVAVAQSPQKSPRLATQIARQAQIAAEVAQVAALRGYALLDAYTALSADPATYVMADGVHPTVAGSALWAVEAEKMFLPWPTV